MKKFSTLSLGLVLIALLQLVLLQSATAQSGNSRIIMRVTVGGVSTDFSEGECGFGTAAFGGFPSEEICAPAVWARDFNGLDSLVCDSIPAGSLAGKIALVRRGGCPVLADGNFSAKALKAQTAGALAVLVANNSATAAHTDCTALVLAGTSTLVTVPVFSLSRTMAGFIDNALNSGQPVEICLHPPNVFMASNFYPVQNVQTPVSQIATDTFGFSVNITNVRGTELTNVIIKAGVQNEAGEDLYTTSITIDTLAGSVVDSFFVIPGLFAPELPIGNYQIVYSTESDPNEGNVFKDLTRDPFVVTENLFAKDNGVNVGSQPGTLPAAGWGVGNLYIMSTGALDNYQVKTAVFAHNSSIAAWPVNKIVADIFLFRVNDDVAADYGNFEGDDFLSNSFQLLGSGGYLPAPNAAAYQLQNVDLVDLNSAEVGVPLENGAHYVLAAFYPDSSGTAFHGFDGDVEVAGPQGIGTMTYSSQWFLGGFQGGASATLRMFIDLVVTTDEKPLPDSYMNVFPNPAKDVVNLGLNLEKATDVTVTIADITGRTVYIDDRSGLTNETLTYQIAQLASGTYLARIATKEGTLTKKFVVQK